MYRGKAAYSDYTGGLSTQAVSMNKVTGTHGPLRAPVSMRASCITDYAPDICKDYKVSSDCLCLL